ncbi:MAG: hypothetical protein GDA43_10605 [Hormoscilla sp. SP5CHS1]|nr:hypothetical protein [Hormoscilla sp. SP12CHS1]MBC6453602.1 hypothetical protein [Hormoscilla sp. SP5CHS1]
MERLRSWKLRYWIGAGYVVPILLAVSSAIIVFWNVEMARIEDEKLRNSRIIWVATYQQDPQVPSEYQGLLPTDSDWQRFKKSALPSDFSGTVDDN